MVKEKYEDRYYIHNFIDHMYNLKVSYYLLGLYNFWKLYALPTKGSNIAISYFILLLILTV